MHRRADCVRFVGCGPLRGLDLFADGVGEHPLDNRTRETQCALLYRIQTLLTVLGAMFHLSNCEKADLYARIAD